MDMPKSEPLYAVLFAAFAAIVVLPPLLALIATQLKRRVPEDRGAGVVAYPIAAMDTLNFVLSLVVLVPVSLSIVGGLILLGIWLIVRPSHFELSPDGLRIVWPLRSSELIPLNQITGVDLTSRANLGWGMRFGAGGFGGTFGRLYTRYGEFTIYASSVSDLVVVRRAQGRPLLITPCWPGDFIARLRALHRYQ